MPGLDTPIGEGTQHFQLVIIADLLHVVERFTAKSSRLCGPVPARRGVNRRIVRSFDIPICSILLNHAILYKTQAAGKIPRRWGQAEETDVLLRRSSLARLAISQPANPPAPPFRRGDTGGHVGFAGALLTAAYRADGLAIVQQGAAGAIAMGQGRAGGGVNSSASASLSAKTRRLMGSIRRGSVQRKAPLFRRRLAEQCMALGQRPQGQRFAGLPCVGVGRRQRVFTPQAVDVQESQEALQFLACVLVVGQATRTGRRCRRAVPVSPCRAAGRTSTRWPGARRTMPDGCPARSQNTACRQCAGGTRPAAAVW